MSDNSEFDDQDLSIELADQLEQPFSIKKYLSEPKELMDKVLFSFFKINSFFPLPLQPLPEVMRPDTARVDSNNMNMIEESAFRHERLKNDVLKVLLNTHASIKAQNRSNFPKLAQFYADRHLVYERYPENPKANCLPTYLLDSKKIISQNIAKKIGPKSPLESLSHRNRIQFNSNFECGNLFRVYQRQHNEFDLILQNDINTKGNNQWFFFSVKNVPKGLSLKFNIVNFTKSHSLFKMGMKPTTFSLVRFEKRKVGWVREGIKVSYDQNNQIRKDSSERPYYKLSFQYKFNFEGDVVYFSQSVPYTVSDLGKFIQEHTTQKRNSKLIKLKDLGSTLGNQELGVLELTDEQSRDQKRVVWIIARQHAGEVTSSFLMEGIINNLLNNSAKSISLLRQYVFKIVPMVNIDGVIHGNSRSQLNGSDPNRKWIAPHKIRNPIIYALKRAIEKDKEKIQMFLDLHSHSRKLGTFFYGNSFKENKMCTRRFPMMICQNDERFCYSSCRFSPCNTSSARHVLFQQCQIPLIYTIESSFYGYEKSSFKIVEYLPRDYREMGATIIETFFDYSSLKNGKKSFLENSLFGEMSEQLELDQEKEENLNCSFGSDSDPSGDEYEESQLKQFLPSLYENKKKGKKLIKSKKKKDQGKKLVKQETPQPSKNKKTEKQSHYRIYFSGRATNMENKTYKQTAKRVIELRDIGVQASFTDSTILRGAVNTAASSSIDKKSSLCVWGQKVEEQLTVMGNIVSVQVDMGKVFMQSREEARLSLHRKSFKLSNRNSSILQVKENNFLNRADCHTLPIRSLSRR